MIFLLRDLKQDASGPVQSLLTPAFFPLLSTVPVVTNALTHLFQTSPEIKFPLHSTCLFFFNSFFIFYLSFLLWRYFLFSHADISFSLEVGSRKEKYLRPGDLPFGGRRIGCEYSHINNSYAITHCILKDSPGMLFNWFFFSQCPLETISYANTDLFSHNVF